MFASLIGFRPMFGEYRKIYTEPGPFETLRTADPGDVVLKPLTHKIKLGNDAVSFGYVERALSQGVDQALVALGKLGNPFDLGKYWGGMAMVMDVMKKAKLMEEGVDSFRKASEREQERNKLYESLANMEIPQISTRTLAALKGRRVYLREGKNFKARESGGVLRTLEKVGRNIIDSA
jgi:hypothetical protein